jgi:hypothetical protein
MTRLPFSVFGQVIEELKMEVEIEEAFLFWDDNTYLGKAMFLGKKDGMAISRYYSREFNDGEFENWCKKNGWMPAPTTENRNRYIRQFCWS